MTPELALQTLVGICGEVTGLPLKNYALVSQASQVLGDVIKQNAEKKLPTDTAKTREFVETPLEK